MELSMFIWLYFVFVFVNYNHPGEDRIHIIQLAQNEMNHAIHESIQNWIQNILPAYMYMYTHTHTFFFFQGIF